MRPEQSQGGVLITMIFYKCMTTYQLTIYLTAFDYKQQEKKSEILMSFRWYRN